jgi:hypothetical protein
MNASIETTNLKAFACGFAALVVTAITSWSFVESTSAARWLGTHAAAAAVASVAQEASVQVAKVAQAALVD